jgi:hypothetical protein
MSGSNRFTIAAKQTSTTMAQAYLKSWLLKSLRGIVTAISGFDHLLVELNGPGGLLVEGLVIGREIRARQFATGVAPDWKCLSACAFAWLAGMPRIAARSATILFHHPWNDEGTPDLDAAASAVAGGYLGSLGLSESAIGQG